MKSVMTRGLKLEPQGIPTLKAQGDKKELTKALREMINEVGIKLE